MARNYTHPTIKTLFGEAQGCAYPGCSEPLVFRDRGRVTVVTEIAHIRSETPGGPRHDPNYTGDVNGPDNLLLLCGKHHRPVDRHESVYKIQELELWKLAQRATSSEGTPLTEGDLRSFQRLSDEERQSLKDLARIAQRVTTVCRSVQAEIGQIRATAERLRRDRAESYGPMWAVDDDGNKTRIDTLATSRLSPVEQREWEAKEQDVWNAKRPQVTDALANLEGEVAVLRMFDQTLGTAGYAVVAAATELTSVVGNGPALFQSAQALDGAVARLWHLANGEIEPA